ncbi:hypothetical protein [Fibrisoma limi]|nr:hypothetical protein [Fibrisoma limi]
MKPAIIVFIQYGKTEQWEKARGKEVALDLPAHILTEDLIYVLAAIQELE